MKEKGFELLEEYDSNGTLWAASKAYMNDLKKGEEVVLGSLGSGIEAKSETERVRKAKGTLDYKDYLIHLEAAERDFLERDCRKKSIEMSMDFLRSAMSMDKEMINRVR